jgi:uncharacterized membrane protein
MRLLLTLWFCTIVIDAVTSVLAAGFIFRVRQRFGVYIAMALLGTAVESLVTLAIIGLWSAGPNHTPYWVIWMRMAARLFKSATNGMLTLYVLGFVNGKYAPKIESHELR